MHRTESQGCGKTLAEATGCEGVWIVLTDDEPEGGGLWILNGMARGGRGQDVAEWEGGEGGSMDGASHAFGWIKSNCGGYHQNNFYYVFGVDLCRNVGSFPNAGFQARRVDTNTIPQMTTFSTAI